MTDGKLLLCCSKSSEARLQDVEHKLQQQLTAAQEQIADLLKQVEPMPYLTRQSAMDDLVCKLCRLLETCPLAVRLHFLRCLHLMQHSGLQPNKMHTTQLMHQMHGWCNAPACIQWPETPGHYGLRPSRPQPGTVHCLLMISSWCVVFGSCSFLQAVDMGVCPAGALPDREAEGAGS